MYRMMRERIRREKGKRERERKYWITLKYLSNVGFTAWVTFGWRIIGYTFLMRFNSNISRDPRYTFFKFICAKSTGPRLRLILVLFTCHRRFRRMFCADSSSCPRRRQCLRQILPGLVAMNCEWRRNGPMIRQWRVSRPRSRVESGMDCLRPRRHETIVVATTPAEKRSQPIRYHHQPGLAELQSCFVPYPPGIPVDFRL